MQSFLSRRPRLLCKVPVVLGCQCQVCVASCDKILMPGAETWGFLQPNLRQLRGLHLCHHVRQPGSFGAGAVSPLDRPNLLLFNGLGSFAAHLLHLAFCWTQTDKFHRGNEQTKLRLTLPEISESYKLSKPCIMNPACFYRSSLS